MEQSALKRRGEGRSALDPFGDFGKLAQRYPFIALGDVLGGRLLEIERAGAIGARRQEIAQRSQVGGFPDAPVLNDSPTPGIRAGISHASGDLTGNRCDLSPPQWEFGQIQGNGIGPLEIAPPIGERDDWSSVCEPAGNYRLCRSRQPDPHKGLGWMLDHVRNRRRLGQVGLPRATRQACWRRTGLQALGVKPGRGTRPRPPAQQPQTRYRGRRWDHPFPLCELSPVTPLLA